MSCSAADCRAAAHFKCARCPAAYCSTNCQSQDWKAGHKRTCGKSDAAVQEELQEAWEELQEELQEDDQTGAAPKSDERPKPVPKMPTFRDAGKRHGKHMCGTYVMLHSLPDKFVRHEGQLAIVAEWDLGQFPYRATVWLQGGLELIVDTIHCHMFPRLIKVRGPDLETMKRSPKSWFRAREVGQFSRRLEQERVQKIKEVKLVKELGQTLYENCCAFCETVIACFVCLHCDPSGKQCTLSIEGRMPLQQKQIDTEREWRDRPQALKEFIDLAASMVASEQSIEWAFSSQVPEHRNLARSSYDHQCMRPIDDLNFEWAEYAAKVLPPTLDRHISGLRREIFGANAEPTDINKDISKERLELLHRFTTGVIKICLEHVDAAWAVFRIGPTDPNYLQVLNSFSNVAGIETAPEFRCFLFDQHAASLAVERLFEIQNELTPSTECSESDQLLGLLFNMICGKDENALSVAFGTLERFGQEVFHREAYGGLHPKAVHHARQLLVQLYSGHPLGDNFMLRQCACCLKKEQRTCEFNRCQGCQRLVFCSESCRASCHASHAPACKAAQHQQAKNAKHPVHVACDSCSKNLPLQSPAKYGATEKASVNRLRCSRCRLAHYCSIECQRRGWTRHKQYCHDIFAKVPVREGGAAKALNVGEALNAENGVEHRTNAQPPPPEQQSNGQQEYEQEQGADGGSTGGGGASARELETPPHPPSDSYCRNEAGKIVLKRDPLTGLACYEYGDSPSDREWAEFQTELDERADAQLWRYPTAEFEYKQGSFFSASELALMYRGSEREVQDALRAYELKIGRSRGWLQSGLPPEMKAVEDRFVCSDDASPNFVHGCGYAAVFGPQNNRCVCEFCMCSGYIGKGECGCGGYLRALRCTSAACRSLRAPVAMAVYLSARGPFA
jgi:hypothetical protein